MQNQLLLDALELGSTANRELGQQSDSLWVLKNPGIYSAVCSRNVCEGPKHPHAVAGVSFPPFSPKQTHRGLY